LHIQIQGIGWYDAQVFFISSCSIKQATAKYWNPKELEVRLQRKLLAFFLLALCFFLNACMARGICVRGNCKNGKGVMTYPEGANYEGGWKDGRRHGQGTLTNPYAGQYKGQWKDDKPDGYGIWLFPDGAKYEGQWKSGEWNGKGTMTFPDGRKYVGEWKNDVPQGLGIMAYPNGVEVEVEFRDGTFVEK
jgi:hypothetical protein